MTKDEDDLGTSANVVLRLSRTVPTGVNHNIYFDNYFTNVDLQVSLAKRGILSVGTVRSNRIHNCTLKSEAELKRTGRGSMDEKIALCDDVEVKAVRWNDNKAVTLLSTFVGSQPVTQVRRWNSRTKTHEQVSCPAIITAYNKHTGGVDLNMDSLLGLYRLKLRSKKWYHRLFFHIVDMSVVNAWLLYRRQRATDENRLTLHEFKASVAVARGLCYTNTGRKNTTGLTATPEATASAISYRQPKTRTPMPCIEARYDGVGHYPQMTDSRQRCSMETCKGSSRVRCPKCGIHLCLISGSDCMTYCISHAAVHTFACIMCT